MDIMTFKGWRTYEKKYCITCLAHSFDFAFRDVVYGGVNLRESIVDACEDISSASCTNKPLDCEGENCIILEIF